MCLPRGAPGYALGAMAAMMPRAPVLYVVTAAGAAPGRGHADVARAAAAGGAHLVQLRAPELDDDALAGLAREVGPEVRARGARLIVNDRLGVALSSGADGVHLGLGDGDLPTARDRLGDVRLLGASASTPAQARDAVAAGADYLGVTVWGTPTKRDASPVGVAGLAAICAAVDIPVLAIGGIDASSAPLALGAGAAGVAVVRAIAAAPDPVAATRHLRAVIGAAPRTSAAGGSPAV